MCLSLQFVSYTKGCSPIDFHEFWFLLEMDGDEECCHGHDWFVSPDSCLVGDVDPMKHVPDGGVDVVVANAFVQRAFSQGHDAGLGTW